MKCLRVSLTLQFFHRVCSLLCSRTNLRFLSGVKNSDVFRVRQATKRMTWAKCNRREWWGLWQFGKCYPIE